MTEECSFGHKEARFLAFTVFLDPQGQKWNLTLREGATSEEVANFMLTCATVTTALVDAEFRPIDGRSPVQWPPKSEQERLAEDVEREARRYAPEIAAKQMHDYATSAIVRFAIKRGIMSDENDNEGKKKIVEIGKAESLEISEFTSKLPEWMSVLASYDTKPSPPPPPKRGGATKPPPPIPAPQNDAPAGGGVVSATEIRIVANPDGSPCLQFWRAGRRYPEETFKPDPEILYDSSPDLQEAFDLDDLRSIGSVYPGAYQIYWEPSENLNSKGKPYHNVVRVLIHSV